MLATIIKFKRGRYCAPEPEPELKRRTNISRVNTVGLRMNADVVLYLLNV